MSDQFYSEKQLTEMGIGSSVSRWRWRQNGSFPNPVKLSAGRTAYVASEIHAWIEAKKASRDAA